MFKMDESNDIAQSPFAKFGGHFQSTLLHFFIVKVCFAQGVAIRVGHAPTFAEAHRCAYSGPCSCGHFEMRPTSVGLTVPKL